MTPERWQRLKELLAPALDLDTSERPAYLEQVCLGDAALRNDLERLLAAEDNAGTAFLSDPPPFAAPGGDLPLSVMPLIGLRVGSYEIVEEIGSGGMGEVYRAVRADDQFRHEVAIKLVRARHDSKAVIRRFKNERQILAGLDHPNIARLLDGGTTEEGLPYFVMELIEGSPIDEYCDKQRLAINERLKLFLQVCSAVHYAHQHLIIHRDVKPSNILVTSDGVPKLLDFGIAKILDPATHDRQLQPTLTIFRAMTPGYASPEQVTGATITTASDLYSLGVVLYELLTGCSPYRLTGRNPQEIARAVCEIELERPSTVVRRTQPEEGGNGSPATLAEVAAQRQTTPDKLSKRLDGDLDNIVLMALRKEPQRRYPSVEQFSLDIQRHLGNLPVMARRDTARYRTSKFVTRHKAGTTAALAIALALLVGMAVTLREAHIARVQQARAERHFKDIRELSQSLMFDIHDSIQNLPGATPARKILVDRALRYLDRLASEPGEDASLKRELATAYERVATVQGNPFGGNLGDLQGAAANYRKAAVIWESLSKANPGNAQDLIGLAGTYRQLAMILANYGGGNPLELIRKAAEICERMEGSVPSDPRIAQELELDYDWAATIQVRTGGDPSGALENSRKALAILEQRHRNEVQDQSLQRRIATIRMRIADSLGELGKRNEALDNFRIALEIFRSDPDYARLGRTVALLQSKRGDVLMTSGDTTAALQSYRQAQALLEPLGKADPQNAQVGIELATAYARVGHALSREGNGSAALAMLGRAIGMLEPLVRDRNHSSARCSLAWSHIWLGELLASTGKTPRALENFRKGATEYRSLMADMPWDQYYRSSLAASYAKAADMLAKMGRLDEAAAEYQSALEIAKPQALARPHGDLPWYAVANAYSGLGDLSKIAATGSSGDSHKERQRWTEAREWYEQSLEAWRQIPNPGVISPAGFDLGDPAHAAKQLAVCKAALEKLNKSPVAPAE